MVAPRDTIKVTTPPCPFCDKTTDIVVDIDSLNRWGRGALIQDAFPEMSIDERELLKTGCHSACWDTMFAPMDPEDR